MYAIYHLIRPAKGRTPGSSASYHFFALFTDTALIPFYVLICLYANQNWTPQSDKEDGWTSFFRTEFATTMVIHVTFYAGIAVGALHLISIAFDLYLIYMFRLIGQLPPDMNPLEDNLTGSTRRSRSSMQHKHKNSEISISSLSSEDFAEKKMGYLSGSTLSVDDRSHLSKVKEAEARAIPFGHSRVDFDNSYSPQSRNFAWRPKQQYEQVNFYEDPQPARSSRPEVGSGFRSRSGSVVNEKNPFTATNEEIPTMPAYSNQSHVRQKTDHRRHGSPERHLMAPTNVVNNLEQKQSLLNDNWYVTDESADLGTPRGNEPSRYQTGPTLPNVDLTLERHDSFQPQPLRPLKMNPPTPPPHEEYPDPDEQHPEQFNGRQNDRYEPIETGVARTMTVASHATIASSVYSESAPALQASGRAMKAAPRGRHYGDLASATRGVRGAVGLGAAQPAINRPVPEFGAHGVPTPASSRTSSPQKNDSRVISRSGVDIEDAKTYAPSQGYGMSRREVSGKIAEEGRSRW